MFFLEVFKHSNTYVHILLGIVMLVSCDSLSKCACTSQPLHSTTKAVLTVPFRTKCNEMEQIDQRSDYGMGQF